MFENFKKITITGGCFETATELELFKKDIVSVVYGRNGSGKTTIAHCVGELVKPDEEKSAEYTVTSDVAIPEDKKHAVFIFDEDFVNEKVKVEGNEELPAIVMLGEQVEIDKEIRKNEIELTAVKAEVEELRQQKTRYNNATDRMSPLFIRKTIEEQTMKKDGWADILREMYGAEMFAALASEWLEKLLKMEEPAESEEVLVKKLKVDYDIFQHAKDTTPTTLEEVTIYKQEDITELEEILKRTVDKPELSEREVRLLTFLTEHGHGDSERLTKEGWAFCPTCLRELTADDRNTVAETMTRLLNQQAERYRGLIGFEMGLNGTVSFNWDSYPESIYRKERWEVQKATDELNKLIEIVMEALRKRWRNIYETMEKPFEDGFCEAYAAAVRTLDEKVGVLNERLRLYNKKVSDLEELKNTIVDENDKAARKILTPLLQMYRRAEEDKRRIEEKYLMKEKRQHALEARIAELKVLKKNTKIALDYINQELQYVFFGKKVKLELGEEGNYRLKVNGKYVKPKRISVGERNVLGLCYFFANLLGSDTEKMDYGTERLIVIDDPVSSFDFGNRVGVMSLLRYQFGHILNGNMNSRILVMSHDLHSVFDLVKIRNEVVTGKRPDQSFMELVNGKLDVKFVQNEYKKLIESVYKYAAYTGTDDPDDTMEMGIGNTMRKMMEAFSSFCYNDSFDKMVRKNEVLNIIPEPQRSYYGSFMGRLTLNSESHMAESVYTLDTITACFTKDEKVQTAKSVLLFLLYVNKPHLMAYLDAGQISTIEGWKAEEAGWIVG